MNQLHLKRFRETSFQPDTWLGKNTRLWAQHCGYRDNKALPDKRLSRKELLDFCSLKKGPSDFDRVVGVCAWGGMRVSNGRRFLGQSKQWLTAVATLRNETKSRTEAYSLFRDLRIAKAMPGCGPAYFTKFVHFLRPDLNGLIMDQWVAKSVHLIFDTKSPKLVKRGTGDTVSDTNTADDYEDYCAKIEQLADIIECSELPLVEERLFSKGGREPASWRAYVKGNWSRDDSEGRRSPKSKL